MKKKKLKKREKTINKITIKQEKKKLEVQKNEKQK